VTASACARFALFATWLAACAARPAPPPAPVAPVAPAAAAPRSAASTGVHDAALAELLERQWTWAMEESPVTATTLGDHRFDDRLADTSFAHREQAKQRRKGFLAEARALKARASLDASDALTLDLFVDGLEAQVAGDAACDFEDWTVSSGSNPVAEWNTLPDLQAVVTPADAAHLLARYHAIPRSIDTSIANLRRGLAAGKLPNATSTKIALAMVDKQLGLVDTDWPLYAPAKKEHPTWSEAERASFASDLVASLAGIRAAEVRWRAFVADQLLPRARSDEQVGLGALPGGAACYASQIRAHTSLPLGADELHQLGLSEIARVNGEMSELGARLFGTRDLAKILKRLRTDPALYFKTEDEVEAKAASALAAAKAKIPDFFGLLPRADCVVRRVPDYEAPYTTIAYYREPNPDGSKPGEYFINTTQPTTRPRYEAEALAYHESIPGHHLQIAIAQELPEMPAFRKYGGSTAYVEGWALYTERLAGEMGLYSDDLSRMGALSFEAWRASRLVVDTGLHAKGWSREQAVAFMLEHTALAENNIRNEVDRYIGWPGQALAYKVGQLTILRLRADAQKQLDARFDLKGFHDVVLGVGPVTMKVLSDEVARWVRSRGGE
jgi:uncharacterized protein (DUF885 family)